MTHFNLDCPVLGYTNTDVITLAHGSGGESTQRLIMNMFAKAFPYLQADTDGAGILCARNMAFTTDSFVVDPIFFPGGNIGSLSVHGTVNDLAMMGAKPLYMSVAFILEEGLLLKDLQTIVNSMAMAAKEAGISIVTGDTKVVGKGNGHGIYINTSGIGIVLAPNAPNPDRIHVGDKIVISGDIARHGMAIMSIRNGIEIDPPILSDSAALNGFVMSVYGAGIHPYCMRDVTRGGVSSALNEIARARSTPIHIRINEESVPVEDNVRGLAELLGIDPLHVASEGRFILFVEPALAKKAVYTLRKFPGGEKAAIIGEVVAEHKSGLVTAKTLLGSEKPIHMPTGEILPRIC